MKRFKIISFIAFLSISNITFGQNLKWIPFNWVGDTLSGKYFDKAYMSISVKIDDLPEKFNMQLDLGATTTVIYGNSIESYLDKYSILKNKLDTSYSFWIQSEKNFMFRNINLKLGSILFKNIDIGHFGGFGVSIPKDSIDTKSEKHIGTIAPDIFQDKILIIDYPNKKLCVTNKIPKELSNVSFQPCIIKDGRIKIPLSIDDKEEYVLFDTGSSLFSLLTTEERALKISDDKIIDSLQTSTWGEYYMVYGRMVQSKIQFGKIQLKQSIVFYDKRHTFDSFYKEERIWGITGNAYFLNNIIIIDYKNKRFGVN